MMYHHIMGFVCDDRRHPFVSPLILEFLGAKKRWVITGGTRLLGVIYWVGKCEQCASFLWTHLGKSVNGQFPAGEIDGRISHSSMINDARFGGEKCQFVRFMKIHRQTCCWDEKREADLKFNTFACQIKRNEMHSRLNRMSAVLIDESLQCQTRRRSGKKILVMAINFHPLIKRTEAKSCAQFIRLTRLESLSRYIRFSKEKKTTFCVLRREKSHNCCCCCWGWWSTFYSLSFSQSWVPRCFFISFLRAVIQ